MTPSITSNLRSTDAEILRFLFKKGKARFKEIRDYLLETPEWRDRKGSLDVRLSRRLKALVVAHYVERKKETRKRVYYSLTRPSWRRLKLEESKLEKFIEEFLPPLTSEPRDRTTKSDLKFYLNTTPPMFFEILKEFFGGNFPEEAEREQINALVAEYVVKVFESMQEELKVKYEQGQNIQEIFEDIEEWVYRKYREKTVQ